MSLANFESNILFHRWCNGILLAALHVCQQCDVSMTPLNTTPFRTVDKWIVSLALSLENRDRYGHFKFTLRNDFDSLVFFLFHDSNFLCKYFSCTVRVNVVCSSRLENLSDRIIDHTFFFDRQTSKLFYFWSKKFWMSCSTQILNQRESLHFSSKKFFFTKTKI